MNRRFGNLLMAGALAALPFARSSSAGTTEKKMPTSESAKSSASAKLSRTDEHAVTRAAQFNLAQIRLGELAKKNGESDDVKKLGQSMIDDAQYANDDLRKLADQKGVAFPSSVSAQAMRDIDKVSAKAGKEFDRSFLQTVITAQRRELSLLRNEQNAGRDKDVKDWAGKAASATRKQEQTAKVDRQKL